MVIHSSNITMGAERTYKRIESRQTSYRSWGKKGTIAQLADAAGGITVLGDYRLLDSQRKKDAGKSQSDLYKKERESTLKNLEFLKAAPYTGYQGSDKIGFESFSHMMGFMFGAKAETKPIRLMSLAELLSKEREKKIQADRKRGKEDNSAALARALDNVNAVQAWGMSYEENYSYEEKEKTTFYSSGTVRTADGRELDFDISATMSRSFSQSASIKIDYEAAYMVDPLVINLESDKAEVREQKFLFDIDGDGKLDNISMLSQICGFLALDKNGDGVINDGKELFGTATGNGFKELAVFDMDGNGWIDENDEIFNKLRIWTKDAQGRDKLVGLGAAGIGAVYLGNIETPFDLKSRNTNKTNAQIRRTGIYLKEDGEAGTIQHVDMAAG